MADSKFDNLPGIAYDQPDVYETPDVPGEATSDYYEEEPENESIQYLHLSPQDSFTKFKGKQVENGVDFSDWNSKKLCKGYKSSTYEFGNKEEESLIEKCRRLQYEMNEVLEQLEVMKIEKKISEDEKESYDAVSNVITTSKKIIDSLRLEQVLGEEHTGTVNNEVQKLLDQFQTLKKSDLVSPNKFEEVNLAASTRVAKLEHRLHELEKAIGTNPEKLSRITAGTGSLSLIEAVRQLNTKAALLQPSQLNQIELRLNSLVIQMNAISEKSSSLGDETERDKKVCELYDIAKKAENIAEILPDIIERMQALESLHKHAMNIAKIIAEVEETQSSISQGLYNNKTLLNSIQETFTNNLDNISKDISKLEARINSI